MDSSSEIEIMPTLKHPSPVKPRRTGRSRRVPRSVDEVAASAAPLARPVKRGRVSKGEDSEEDETSASKSPQVDVDVKLLPKQQPPLPPLPAAPASKAKPVEVLTISSSASSTLASRSAEPTLPSKRQSPAPPPPSAPTPRAGSAPKPSSSNLAAGIKRPRSHTPGSGAAAPRKALPKKPVGGDSSDEADSFFQSKSTFKGRVPKAAGGGGGRQPGGGGRKPNAGPSSSAALTGSAKGKARYEFSTDSEVDQPKKKKAASISSSSSAATSDSALSNSDSDSAAHKLSAKKKGIKHVNLPSWARGKTSAQAGMSGADKAALARGYKANRKRKDLKDSDGEKSEVDRLAAFMEEEEKEDTDDSLELEISTPNRKKPAVGAKKKKPNVAGFSADDEPTPRAKLARPRPTASPARPPPRRREASTTSAAAGPSNPKPTPTKRNPDPRSHLSISSGSSSSDNNDDASLARSLQRKEYSKKSPRKAAAEEEEEEDDLATILANVRRLKEPVEASSARLSVDANGRSVSMGVARPTPSPAKSAAGRGLSSSPQKGAEEEGGVVDVSVRMVFDPTRTVAPMAKQVYEREEKFEVNVNDSFEDLFYSLSLSRSIPRDNLILTFLPPSPSSHSSSTPRPTQVFEFGTPASLGLKAGEEAALRGYTKEVWEKVKKLEREKMERLQAQASVSERGSQLGGGGGGGVGAGGGGAAAVEEEDDDDELEAAAAAAAAAASQRPRSPSVGGAASPHDDDGGAGGGGGNGGPPPGLFPLTIRGSKTDSLSLAVKPTTTMAQLVKAYCKKFGGVAAKAWLEFDGDKLEGSTTVGEAKEEFDLEGEETFEIKRLS